MFVQHFVYSFPFLIRVDLLKKKNTRTQVLKQYVEMFMAYGVFCLIIAIEFKLLDKMKRKKNREFFRSQKEPKENYVNRKKSLGIRELNSKRIIGSMVGVMTLNLSYLINRRRIKEKMKFSGSKKSEQQTPREVHR